MRYTCLYNKVLKNNFPLKYDQVYHFWNNREVSNLLQWKKYIVHIYLCTYIVKLWKEEIRSYKHLKTRLKSSNKVFLDFITSRLWWLKHAFFFPLHVVARSCFCRSAAIGQLRRQSPPYHRGPDEADMRGSAHCFTALGRAWRHGRSRASLREGGAGGGGGGRSRMARRLRQSAVRKKKPSSQLVLLQDRTAPAARQRRHNAGQRQRSQMLSSDVRWHANSIIIIAVISLFALSGPNQGRSAGRRAAAPRARLGGQWKITFWVLGKSSEVRGDVVDVERGHHQVTGSEALKVQCVKKSSFVIFFLLLRS